MHRGTAGRPLRRWLLIAAGVLLTAVGLVGIVVPLLPTTPFLLLAAACFLRSSDRMYRWLTTHRWFGSYIRNYHEHRAITSRARIVALVVLWGTLGYTTFGLVSVLWLRIILLLIGLGTTVHLLSLNTAPSETPGDRIDGDDSRGP